MRRRDIARQFGRERDIDAPRDGEVVERLRFIKAAHLENPLDGFTCAAQRERSAASDNRHEPQVNLRCEGTVSLDLGFKRRLAPRERGEIEKREFYGPLHLPGVSAGEKHRCGVGIDARNFLAAMCCRIGEKRKDFALEGRAVCHLCPPAPAIRDLNRKLWRFESVPLQFRLRAVTIVNIGKDPHIRRLKRIGTVNARDG